MGKSFVYNKGAAEDDKIDDEIRAEFGVFIDGTLNNKDNTDLRAKYGKDGNKGDKGLTPKEKEERKKYIAASHRKGLNEGGLDKMGTDNSFSNDHTNVARKWMCCKKEYRIYVPGMGTSDVFDEKQGIARDDDDGFQYGAGSISGIRARVRKGCERLAEMIKKEVDKGGKKKATEITVDVFGFSRGAAAARNFVYEVTKGECSTKEIEIPYLKSVYIPEKITHDEFGIAFKVGGYYSDKRSKCKVKADDDGLEIDTTLLINGKLPKMGHLGYSLRKLKITPEQLEQIEIKVRFLGIYDTVSSYEEWGPLGGDSTIKKGLTHIRPGKSLFNDDVVQLNLNTLRCAKIVHFTAKDEHRENFALTRILDANIKDAQGNIRRIEKNFPGVHCDIGGAYFTAEDYVDEIEVVNKAGGGFKNPGKVSLIAIALLKEYGKKLISEYWYKNEELKIQEEWGATKYMYHKLSGTRKKIYKEYSYIPLHFMKNHFIKYMKDFFIESSFKKYEINDKNLKATYAHLKPYVMNEGGKEWNFISDEVFIRKQKMEELKKLKAEKVREEKTKKSIIIYETHPVAIDKLRLAPKRIPELIMVPKLTEDQKLLRLLRNQYFHWSANRDWLGMDPTEDRKRVFFPKNK